MRFCRNCGRELRAGASFCTGCGMRIARAEDERKLPGSGYVPWSRTHGETRQESAHLIFQIYIPADGLYSAEAAELLSLFHLWLVQARGQNIRREGYKTASGEMFEFYADTSVAPKLNGEFQTFATFLDLCVANPSVAVETLGSTRPGSLSSADLVDMLGSRARQLQVGLHHQRERRITTIRQNLEAQLVEQGVDFQAIPARQLEDFIGRLIPDPTAPTAPLELLAGESSSSAGGLSITLNFSPQIINAVESTIFQNVHGTIHLGPEAKQLLELVKQFGGQQRTELEAAVRELEDPAAPTDARRRSRQRLKEFLAQVGTITQNVAISLLEKYLESKGF
jgi:zinc-ribbon domain